MKTITIFNKINMLLLIVAVLSGCNQSEEATRIPSDSDCFIHAQLENTAQTRSWINFEGKMSWSVADYLGVYGEESQNIPFHYSSQMSEDGFSGNLDTRQENIVVSYFPYNEKAQLKGQKLSFQVPEVSDYTSENEAPMIGLPISKNTLRFKQLGGIFYLRMFGIPDDATQLTIESVGKDKKYLSGTLNVPDIHQKDAIFTFTQGSYKRTFNIEPLAGSSKRHALYLPVEVGKYSKIEFSVWNSKHEKISTKSVSNLEVNRAHVINTPIMHFSDKIYYCEIPKDAFKDTKINQAFYFSNDVLITREITENEDKIIRIQKIVRSSKIISDQFTATINKAGKVKSLSIKDNHAWINDDGSILCIQGDEIEHIKNATSIPVPNTRIGVEESHFWQEVAEINSMIDLLNKLGKKQFKELMIDKIKDVTIELLEGQQKVEVSDLLNPKNFDSIFAFLAYMEKKSNEESHELYDKYCGRVTVQTVKPSVNGNIINCGYKTNGTNTIGTLYSKFKISHTCGLIVTKVPNGDALIFEPTLKTRNAIILGKNNLLTDRSFVGSINYERGYTYYFRSYVAMFGNDLADYPVCYYGATEKISIPNTRIESITFKDAKVNGTNIDFFGSAQVSFQDQTASFKYGIVLYRNGKEYRTFFPSATPKLANIDFSFGAIWTTPHLDLEMNDKAYIASTKGHWQLGTLMISYSSDGIVKERIYNNDLVDIDFKYDKKPRAKFINAKILGTEVKKPSRQARAGLYDDGNDPEDEIYTTTFSYEVYIESSIWIAKIIQHCSDPATAISKSDIYNDGIYKFVDQVTYSKKSPVNPVITIEIGTVTFDHFFSENALHLGGGCPLTSISIH